MVSPALLTSAEAVAAVAGGAANAAAGVALGPLLRALPFGGRAWKELRTSKTFRKARIYDAAASSLQLACARALGMSESRVQVLL